MTDSLQHAGVKGMRWGVHKKRETSSDYKESLPLRKKSPKEMSDAELRKVANRIRLEREYSQLNQSTISKGKSATEKLLSGSFKAVATAGLTAGFTILGKMAIDRIAKEAKTEQGQKLIQDVLKLVKIGVNK